MWTWSGFSLFPSSGELSSLEETRDSFAAMPPRDRRVVRSRPRETTAAHTRQTWTFVNCMQQMRTYHYFEIVYVKVIFLHVGCCYFVFRKCVVFFFFFVTRRQKKSLRVETCHIENVVRSKAKKRNKKTFCLYFWEHFSFVNVGVGLGNQSYTIILSSSFIVSLSFLLYFCK